jgi:hypothetical protein
VCSLDTLKGLDNNLYVLCAAGSDGNGSANELLQESAISPAALDDTEGASHTVDSSSDNGFFHRASSGFGFLD